MINYLVIFSYSIHLKLNKTKHHILSCNLQKFYIRKINKIKHDKLSCNLPIFYTFKSK